MIYRQRIVAVLLQPFGIELDFSGLGNETVLGIERGPVLRAARRREYTVLL